jgi:hypothetical protein
MPNMVPPVVAPGTPSSERRVFEKLRDSKTAYNWTILHSLGFSSGWTGTFGEIDFVILIPGVGIVCVEVKGGRVTHQDGIWWTQALDAPHPEQLKRSPFKQAQEGMWKLKQALDKKFGVGSLESKCPIGWMAILPDVKCPPVTPEFTRAEVIDHSEMDNDICEHIVEAPSLAALRSRGDLRPPAEATCRRMLAFLRPNFDRVALAHTDLWDTERRLQSLTEEQYEAIDAIADNPVCLVKGPAGTGKTNIALECARRLTISQRRVLVACFNRNLGEWLSISASRMDVKGIVCGHLHGILRDRILRSSFADELRASPETDADDLFGRKYFELGALAIEELNERFDAVLIDEAQDFDPDRLADVLRAWTSGVRGCRTIMFGDFTRQALYGCSQADHKRLRDELNAAMFNLTLNCRNTRRIAAQTELMSGFSWSRYSPKQPEGDPVEVFYVRDERESKLRIQQVVKSLKSAGFRPGDIVLLGPRKRENSSVATSTTIEGWRLRELGAATDSDLAYATIHSFKGLERPVVILIDAGADDLAETDSLLYVGMSRARVRLFVICEESVKATVDKRVTAGILAMEVGR